MPLSIVKSAAIDVAGYEVVFFGCPLEITFFVIVCASLRLRRQTPPEDGNGIRFVYSSLCVVSLLEPLGYSLAFVKIQGLSHDLALPNEDIPGFLITAT